MNKIILVLAMVLTLCSCKSKEVPKGELNRIYEGMVILTLDGNSYTCQYIDAGPNLSLLCRQNVSR